MPYQAFADTVLFLHFGISVFVVLGLPAILLGNKRGWPWVNNAWWRLSHLGAIGVIVLQTWLGQHCPLTVLESWLREQAGQAGYERSFFEYWIKRVLYYEAPMWVFVLVYTFFGLLVVWAWWRFPPKRGGARKKL